MAEVIRQRYFQIEGNEFVDKGKSSPVSERGSGRFWKRSGLVGTFMVGGTILGVGAGTLAASVLTGTPPDVLLNTPVTQIPSGKDQVVMFSELFGMIIGFVGSLPVAGRVERLIGLT